MIDTPISEMGFVGAAVGAAMTGLRPIVEIMFMDFIGVCLDPILNQAAKLPYMTNGQLSIPIVFRTQTGGGRSAGAQHSQSLEAMLAHVPGLKVVMPATVTDAHDLLIDAVNDPNPVVYVENRRLYASRGLLEEDRLPLGRARVARAGNDVTIVTWGQMLRECLTAAEASEGSVEVIDLRSLVPLDLDTVLACVERTGRLLIVHEAAQDFGAGARDRRPGRPGAVRPAPRPRPADRRAVGPDAVQPFAGEAFDAGCAGDRSRGARDDRRGLTNRRSLPKRRDDD